MTIVTKLSEILKSSTHLSEMEEAITSLVRELTTTLLSERLEALDKEMVQPYLSKGWAIDRIEERQLTFSFGTLIFKRRRLRKSGEKSFLPLDRALGLPPRERFSPSFKEKISELATGMTYRKASETLELLTNISMSHQTVHRIAQEVAEKIAQTSEPESASLRKPKVLYIEADGVWLGCQTKGQHLEFKRGFIHEGISKNGNRGSLINPVYFGTFGTSKDLFTMISDYLRDHYDLSETLIIANSDGGSGYESDKFASILDRHSRFEYCLDSYHVMRHITGKLGFNKSLQAAVRQAVKAYDLPNVTLLLDTAESLLEDEKEIDRLVSLRVYLEGHWKAIKPLSDRGLSVSSGVGVCESGHRYYTNRMKRQGRHWSKGGAENMARLLTALRNGDFKTRYRAGHQEISFSPEVRIAMRKVLKQASHHPHTIPQARIALHGATSTPIGQLKKWI